MSTDTATFKPVDDRASAYGPASLGVAIEFPGRVNSLAAVLFMELLNSVLNGQAIPAEPSLGFGRSFAVSIIEVPERNRAIQILQAAALKSKLLGSLIEIAYWDASEHYWRVVYPKGRRESFERFLKEEALLEASELLRADTAAGLEAIWRKVERESQEANDERDA